jgi:hypothetical protein
MNELHENASAEHSRGSLLRAAALSALTAVPVVAALASPRSARANPECVDVICTCTGCYGGCTGGGINCKAECVDAHSGSFCWNICTWQCSPCSTGC